VEVPTAPPGPGPKTKPGLRTKASERKAELDVRADGTTRPTKLFDRVIIKRYRKAADSVGRATLYGPFRSLADASCRPADRVKTVRFTPRNGTVRTPKVAVDEPGWYTWRVVVAADRKNKRVSHRCGMKAESTLVHRDDYGPFDIETGATDHGTAQVAGRGLDIPKLGIQAPVVTVGATKDRMKVPSNIHTLGWLNRSAQIGEMIGNTVIAGHVSDNHDRPGALWKLRNAKKGQVVTVRDAQGKRHKYRITGRSTHLRSKSLPKRIFATTGAHRLVLVTCTARVTYPNGSFHYTRNLVVVAKPVK
jgi:sortase (surface protein transpeptidase)